MAQLTAHCPFCGQSLTIEEEWIGRNGECPSCGKTFPIADDDAPPPPPEEPSEPASYSEAPSGKLSLPGKNHASGPFVFICPSCGTQVTLPGIMLGRKYTCSACAEEAIAEPTTEKQCPFCGGSIKIQATVCKYCRNHLSDPTVPTRPIQPVDSCGRQSGMPYGRQPMPGTGSYGQQPMPGAGSYGQLAMPGTGPYSQQPGMPYGQQAMPGAGPYGQQPGMPYAQQPQYGTPPRQPPRQPWTLTKAEARSIRGTTKVFISGIYCLLIGLILSFAGRLIFSLFLMKKDDVDMGTEFSILGLGFMLPGAILVMIYPFLSGISTLVLLYKYWKLVPPREAETTPGKALGFLFIPFFNLYWMFVAFWMLSKHYDRFVLSGGPSGLALWSLIMLLLSWIPIVGFLCAFLHLVFWICWVLQMRNAALALPQVE